MYIQILARYPHQNVQELANLAYIHRHEYFSTCTSSRTKVRSTSGPRPARCTGCKRLVRSKVIFACFCVFLAILSPSPTPPHPHTIIDTYLIHMAHLLINFLSTSFSFEKTHTVTIFLSLFRSFFLSLLLPPPPPSPLKHKQNAHKITIPSPPCASRCLRT